MSIWTSALNGIWAGIQYLFFLWVYWLSMFFVMPFKNLEILWILIPIWINLIFTDFFQEKKGTSLGNAVTNGAVMLWVCIDWIRFIIRTYNDVGWTFTMGMFLKFLLCTIGIALGIYIIIEGVKGKKAISFIGRVRETSYFLLVLSPAVYGIEMMTFRYALAIILFFPMFYYLFELIDKLIPDPKTYGGSDSGRGKMDDFKF